MTHDEIVERLNKAKNAMDWSNAKIGVRAGVNKNKVALLLRGENIGLYPFLDILDGMGLEINII